MTSLGDDAFETLTIPGLDVAVHVILLRELRQRCHCILTGGVRELDESLPVSQIVQT